MGRGFCFVWQSVAVMRELQVEPAMSTVPRGPTALLRTPANGNANMKAPTNAACKALHR